jgi:hypothetical protein
MSDFGHLHLSAEQIARLRELRAEEAKRLAEEAAQLEYQAKFDRKLPPLRQRIAQIGTGLLGLGACMLWATFFPPGGMLQFIPFALFNAVSVMAVAAPLTVDSRYVRERVTKDGRTVGTFVGVAVIFGITLYWIEDILSLFVKGTDHSLLWSTLTIIG